MSSYLFLFGCMPVRSLIALYAKENPGNAVLRAAAFVLAASFAVLWMKPELRPTGAETFGAPIWWNDARIVHALLWLAYALCEKWEFLAVDVIVGLMAFFFMKP